MTGLHIMGYGWVTVPDGKTLEEVLLLLSKPEADKCDDSHHNGASTDLQDQTRPVNNNNKNNMKTLKIGDAVWLKSGGPEMAVRGDSPEEGFVLCDWFEGVTRQSWTFHEDQLTTTNPKRSKMTLGR